MTQVKKKSIKMIQNLFNSKRLSKFQNDLNMTIFNPLLSLAPMNNTKNIKLAKVKL